MRLDAAMGPAPARWQPAALLLAPHRLGFFLAMVVLGASGLWWALVQLQRVGLGPALGYAVSPTLIHATVMSFGFIPLFFSGFLFTAGPRWLGVAPPSAHALRWPLGLQASGWLLWLAGGHLHAGLAAIGLLLALSGLSRVTWMFARLVHASLETDRLHATTIAVAHGLGCLSLAGVGAALAFDAVDLGRACVVSGLWCFVVVTYVSVAHRMIPFFTSSALPLQRAWRPFWVLWLLLGVAAFEAGAVWLELALAHGAAQPGVLPAPWRLARAALELSAGGVLVWLTFMWGLVQSLKIRLLAMLHVGFLWLGLALLVGGVAQLATLASGEPVLALAQLHALTMGCLASLMLAMVTRVSCGHSGRPLVADNIVWSLFWLLQGAALLRLAATLPGVPAPGLLAAAALLWAGLMLAWGIRYGGWYGRTRTDGRPG